MTLAPRTLNEFCSSDLTGIYIRSKITKSVFNSQSIFRVEFEELKFPFRDLLYHTGFVSVHTIY